MIRPISQNQQFVFFTVLPCDDMIDNFNVIFDVFYCKMLQEAFNIVHITETEFKPFAVNILLY